MFSQENAMETSKQIKGARRKKHQRLKPKEQEGMPQHQHCPPTKHREDRNPKYQYQKNIIIKMRRQVHNVFIIGGAREVTCESAGASAEVLWGGFKNIEQRPTRPLHV
jgi:hypothetical protein